MATMATMAQASEPAILRWTDEEHDLLVKMTNYQLELEEKDPSNVISWAKHWKQVSLRLQEYGYSRTPAACQSYNKRALESQRSNEHAAGLRWDDSEHQILMGMTEDQLEVEKVDPSSIIPWPRHWKTVSLRLEENGYTRSADACAAYYTLIQVNPAHDVAPDSRTDSYSQSWEADDGIEDDEYFPVELRETPTQPSTKIHLWTNEEYENLLLVLKACIEREKELKLGISCNLWKVVSVYHNQRGFDRTWEACKTYWQDEGRARSGLDERLEPSLNSSGNESRLFGSKPSSVSSMWSPVNDLEDTAMESETSTPGNSTHFQKVRSQSGAEVLPNRLPAPDPNPLLTSSIDALLSGSGSMRHDSNRTQGEPKNDKSTGTATQPLNPSEMKSAEQVRDGTFRFTPRQRAYLEAEGALNGFCPDTKRRGQLATALGVDEKTVRNWFNHARQKSKRSQGGATNTDASMSAPSSENTPSNKRPVTQTGPESSQASINTSSTVASGEDDTPSHSKPFKKPRLGEVPSQGFLFGVLKPTIVPEDQASRDQGEISQNRQTSPEQAPSMRRGSGREDQLLGNPLSQMVQSPNASSSPGNQALLDMDRQNESWFNSGESGSLRAEQQSSILNPITKSGPQKTPAASADITNKLATNTPGTSSPKSTTRQNNSSQISSSTTVNNQPSQNNPATPQAATTPPATQNTPSTTEPDPKAFASRQVTNFQSEIQKLHNDTTSRTNQITIISCEMEELKKEREKCDQDKEEEIKRVMKEIQERYEGKKEGLKGELERKGREREGVAEGLKRNERELERKETGIRTFMAVVEYYESEGGG